MFDPKLPSILYLKNPVPIKELARSDVTPIIIELFADCIFLAMYYRQVTNSSGYIDKKAALHVLNSINTCRAVTIRCFSYFKFNPSEENLFLRLNNIITSILFDNIVENNISSIQQIDDFFNASFFDVALRNEVLKSICFILSAANQIDYSDDQVTLPYIRIFNVDDVFSKSLITINTPFLLKRGITNGSNPSELWYRIFSGMIIPKNSRDTLSPIEYLAHTVSIGVIPNVQTGMGLNVLPFESYLASESIRKLSKEDPSICFYNRQLIIDAITVQNAWLFENDYGIFPALEADFSDSVSADALSNDTLADTPDNLQEDNATDEASDNEEDQTADDGALSEPEDPSLTDTQMNDTEGEQTDTFDTTEEAPQSKTHLLGFDVKLATSETIDTFMYKLSVMNYIDDTLKYNHDDLPTETLGIIKRWKSSFLFLTDAEETKNLFKKLKIRFS